MYRVDLCNLPFASLGMPSLALKQLEAVANRRLGNEVSTNVHYLNHRFADYMGIEGYQELAGSVQHVTSGVGDWMFRHVAFPELEDNAEDYFTRYYRGSDDKELREMVLEKREGLEAEVDRLIEKAGLLDADLVGVTSMFSTHGAALALARRIKEKDDSIVTVMGGANCEAPMGRVIADEVDWMDFVFSGPSLKSFPKFLEHQIEGEQEKCHQLDGVLSAKNESAERKDQKHEPSTNGGPSAEEGPPNVDPMGDELHINETPHILDWEPFLEKLDERFPDEQVPRRLLFQTSRGCWWGEKAHCTFCGLNGATMDYRSLDVDKARELFEHLFEYSSYASDIQLHCTDNIIPKPYLEELLPELDTPDNMRLFYEVKANLSREDVEVMADAQVESFQPGIEALSTDVLGLMRKGTTVFVNLNLLKNCRRFDLFPTWNLLIGFPGEEEQVYRKYLEDLPLLTHLPPPGGTFPVRFDRYSPYFTAADEYGLDLQPLEFYELTYPFDEENLAKMAYYFRDHNWGAGYKEHVAEYLKPLQEKLDAWQGEWHGEEATPPPRLALHRRDGEPWIHDTRPGWEGDYAIEEEEAEVLMAMPEMSKISLLRSNGFEDYSPDRLSEIIGGLEEKGLVFREGERVMSLVMPADDYPEVEPSTEAQGDPLRAKLTA